MESYIDFIKKYNEKSVTSSENDSEFDNFLKGGANKNILGGFPKVYDISDTNKLNKKEYASDISNILNSKVESPFIAMDTGGYSDIESIGLPEEFATESIPSEVKHVDNVDFEEINSIGGVMSEESINFPSKIEYENISNLRTIKSEFNKDIVMVDSDVVDSDSLKFPEYIDIESEAQDGGKLEDSESLKFPEFIEVESEEQIGGDDRDCGCEEGDIQDGKHCGPLCEHDDIQDGGNLENSDSIKFPEFIEVESEELTGGEDKDCGCEENDPSCSHRDDKCNHRDEENEQNGGNIEDSESLKFPEFIEIESDEQIGGNVEDSESVKFPEIKIEANEQSGGNEEDSESLKFPEFIEIESDELKGGNMEDSESLKFPDFLEIESESGSLGLRNSLIGGADSETLKFPNYIEIETDEIQNVGSKELIDSESLKFPDFIEIQSE